MRPRSCSGQVSDLRKSTCPVVIAFEKRVVAEALSQSEGGESLLGRGDRLTRQLRTKRISSHSQCYIVKYPIRNDYERRQLLLLSKGIGAHLSVCRSLSERVDLVTIWNGRYELVFETSSRKMCPHRLAETNGDSALRAGGRRKTAFAKKNARWAGGLQNPNLRKPRPTVTPRPPAAEEE
jgi:hypothetical protein